MTTSRILNLKGFSLIELSIVMTIAATMAVAYMTWMQTDSQDQGEKLLLNQQKLDTIDKALKRFRVARGRLPCPAKSELPATGGSGSITNSEEYPPSSGNIVLFDDEYLKVDGAGSVCEYHVGAVPTRALGLPTDYMFDAWGNKITYHVAPSLCGDAPSGCTPDTYNANVGDIIITNTTALGGANITLNAAYVIQAHNELGSYAFRPSGIASIVLTNPDEVTNGTYVTDTSYPEITPVTYRFGPMDPAFGFMVLYKTKNQIESEIVAPTTRAIPLAFCQDNATRLAAIDQTALSDAFNNLTITRVDIGGGQFDNYGDEALLGLLFTVQEICRRDYPLTFVCPGGGTAQPQGCSCANGGWNGSC